MVHISKYIKLGVIKYFDSMKSNVIEDEAEGDKNAIQYHRVIFGIFIWEYIKKNFQLLFVLRQKPNVIVIKINKKRENDKEWGGKVKTPEG